MSNTSRLLPLQPMSMTTAQLAAVSFLARYAPASAFDASIASHAGSDAPLEDVGCSVEGPKPSSSTCVRWPTAAAATLTVAVFLVVAALVFAFAQRQQLEQSITEAARQQAADIAAQVGREGAAADFATGAGDQSLVQIVDAEGKVVAASPSVHGEPPVVDARPEPGSTVTLRSVALPIGAGESFVVVAQGVSGPDGHLMILVAESLELVGESTGVVVNLLLIGYPVVVLGVALASYWLAGRALAPVEAIRARVARVEGTSELDARVPVPEGDDEVALLAPSP